MPNLYIILGLTALYFFIILAFVVYARFKETKQLVPGLAEFFLAKKDLHPLVLAGTFAASYFSTWSILGLPGMIYKQGIGALYFVFVLDVVGLIAIFWIGPKLRRYAEKKRIFSPVEILSGSYDSRLLGFVIALLFTVFLMPYISLQLVGIGSFLSAYSGGELSYLTGVGSMMAVVLIYLFLGGMRAVAYTDIIQLIAILIGLCLGMFYLFDLYDVSYGGLLNETVAETDHILSLPGPLGTWTWPMIISAGLVSVGIMFQPHLLTRCMMASKERDIKILVFSTAISRLVISVFSIGIAMVALKVMGASLGANDMMGAVFEVMASSGMIGLILSGLMLMGALGAAMSTADSLLISIGQVATRDMIRPYLRMTPKRQILLSKAIMLFVLAVAFVAGLNPPKIMVDLGVYSGAGCGLIIPTVLCFKWRHRSKLAAFSSIGVGVIALLGFAVYKFVVGSPFLGVHPGFIPVILSFLVYFFICFAQYEYRRK